MKTRIVFHTVLRTYELQVQGKKGNWVTFFTHWVLSKVVKFKEEKCL